MSCLPIILTHQDAESHHSQKTLQENPKGVHQGAVLAAPRFSTWRWTGRCRRVDGGHCRHAGSPRHPSQRVSTAHSSHKAEKAERYYSIWMSAAAVLASVRLLPSSWWSANNGFDSLWWEKVPFPDSKAFIHSSLTHTWACGLKICLANKKFRRKTRPDGSYPSSNSF